MNKILRSYRLYMFSLLVDLKTYLLSSYTGFEATIILELIKAYLVGS